MRLATLTRRTVAVTASTALLLSGGAAIAQVAYAAPGDPPTVSSADPNAGNNTTTATFVVSGTGFNPAQATVTLVPTFTAPDPAYKVQNINAPIDATKSSTTALTVTPNLSQAAPGPYSIQVTQAGLSMSGMVTGTCNACYSVTSLGAAQATKVVFGPTPSNGTARGAGSLDITGSLIARGARVQFLNTDCSVDTNVTFFPGNPNNTAAQGGYPSATLLQGNYTAAAGFTPGKHYLRIVNTDGKVTNPNDCTAGTTEFWTPTFSSGAVVPATRGQNSANQTVTLTGQGIRQGSSLSIPSLGSNTCADIVVGASTVSLDGTTLSAPVSLIRPGGCSSTFSSTAGRSVTISGPDGARFGLANQFAASLAPTISTLDNGAIKLGRGAVRDVTVQGDGFVGSVVGGACVNCTQFSFGGAGVTAVTKNVSAGAALVTITVAPDAVTGGRTVSAVNPDAGNSSTGADISGAYLLTINPAPVPSSVTPASAPRSTLQKSVSIQGSNFNSNGMTITITGDGVFVTGVTVSKGVNGAPDIASFKVDVASTATAGLRDVILENTGSNASPGDYGRYVCSGCFGVDSLSVSPNADSNSNSASQVTLNGVGMTGASVATLYRPGTDPAQGITASVTPTTGNLATATFNLLDQATGKYNLSVTTAGDPITCASCFTVTGQAPVLTSIDPDAGGQGAVNIPFTVVGTKIARGTQVVIGTVSDAIKVHDVTWVDNTTLTGLIDVPTATASGAKDVKLVSADGVYTSNVLTGGFTVNVGPKLKAVAPASVGQGASAFDVTFTGSDFVSPADGEPGTQPVFGPGITVTDVVVTQGTTPTGSVTPNDDTLKATITVDQDAATGPRDVSVINSDKGMATLTGKFTVNPGPKVTSVSPNVLSRGAADQAMVITGSGFAQGATPSIAGVTFSDTPVVSEDGTTITGNVTVASDATRGPRAVTVLNPADKGFGSCSGCFTIADRPSAPSIDTITPGTRQITVTWLAPADNGGSAITSYTVSAGDGVTPVTVAGDVFTATLTGLTANKAYTVSVVAQNAQGVGPAATRTATPYGEPLPPTTVTASSTSSSITVSWSGADPQGSPITNYTIKRSNGSTADETEVGNVSSYTFTNVQPGTVLTFTVKAKNAAGYGAYSTASGSATAKYATTLTSVRQAGTPVAGSAVTYRGTLKQGSDPVAGATVQLALTPDIGTTRNVSVTTDSAGNWTYRVGTTYNTTVRASYAGSSTQAASTATAYKILIAARVVRTSPATGSRSSHTAPVAIKGYTSPNKAGRLMYLYEGTRLVQRAKVASNGTWTFNVTLPAGNHRLYVYIPASSGNTVGKSAVFQLYRT